MKGRRKKCDFFPFYVSLFRFFLYFNFIFHNPFLLLLSIFPFLLQSLIQSLDHNCSLSLPFSFPHFSATLSFGVGVWKFMKKNGFKNTRNFFSFTDRVTFIQSIVDWMEFKELHKCWFPLFFFPHLYLTVTWSLILPIPTLISFILSYSSCNEFISTQKSFEYMYNLSISRISSLSILVAILKISFKVSRDSFASYSNMKRSSGSVVWERDRDRVHILSYNNIQQENWMLFKDEWVKLWIYFSRIVAVLSLLQK